METPPAERVNRRIVNRRMREELAVGLRYPSYEEGSGGVGGSVSGICEPVGVWVPCFRGYRPNLNPIRTTAKACLTVAWIG